MFKIKLLLFLGSLCIPAIVRSQYTDVINSNRPGESQGAFAVGKSVFQVESGVYGIKEEHSLLGTEVKGFGADLNLRWGLFFEQLEFNVELQYQADSYKTSLGFENRSALKQTTIGAKYLVYDPFKNRDDKVNIYSWKANHRFKWNQFIPAVAVYAGINLNFENPYTFATEPIATPKVALIAQNQFSGGFVLVTNIIADKIGSDFPSYGYIVTLTKGFNEKWSGFIENQGYKSDFYADAILRGGAAYLITRNLQVDASLSTNFKDTPAILFGGIGASWRFDKNYKPVLLKSKNKQSKGSK